MLGNPLASKYIYIYMCIYMCVYKHTYIHIHVYVCMYVCVCVYYTFFPYKNHDEKCTLIGHRILVV